MPINTALRLDTPYTPDAALVAERTESALGALWAVLEAPGLTIKHRRELLSIGIWKYTEAFGHAPHPKYRLRFRSHAAMDMAVPAVVQHEHVWPRRWIIDRL